ncbi:MAG: hypothetical protein KatS3mg111_1088 [Pirellulaceae bacterium]|nr:MAG: hypothetical protein KatS3mg111_1088 [Pirellulaceae bacterium]
MQNYARIGMVGIVALFALRFGVGYHFYMEGVSKVQSGDFSSRGFLVAAKGPLADEFHSLIWDYDGRFRLDQEKVNGYLNAAGQRAAEHFGFDDQQKKRLATVTVQYIGKDSRGRWLGKINEVYAEDAEDIEKYLRSTERLDSMSNSDMYSEVASLRGQREKVSQDLKASVEDTLAAIDALWKQFELDLNRLATPEQLEASGYFRIARPGEPALSTEMVDQIIPIFDMAVGILLMLGLLTPIASGAAGLFLVSVVLSQWPGAPGAQPTYYQSIEALACFVLMGTQAGRFAGLDFIPWAWWQNRRARLAAAHRAA